MIRRPPRSTRTDTLFPYTTLFRYDPPVRSPSIAALAFYDAESGILYMKGDASDVDWPAAFHALFAPLEQLSHGTDMKPVTMTAAYVVSIPSTADAERALRQSDYHPPDAEFDKLPLTDRDRKSTRLNSSH